MLATGIQKTNLFMEYEPLLNAMGIALVDINRVDRGKNVAVSMVIVAKGDEVSVDHCAKVYRLVYPRMELQLGERDLQLEVSTPGLQRTFKDVYEFSLFTGRRVRVYDTAKEAWVSGIIAQADPTSVQLTQVYIEDAKEMIETMSVAYADIQKAKLAIRSMVAEKNISEELVISTIEDILRAAYKRKFGTDENAVIEFSEDYMTVELASRRKIVDDDNWYNEVTEIPLSEAKEIHEECEIGDELLIPVDLKEFDRISVQSAKQRAHQSFRDIQKDTLYSEYKAKEGQLIIGYYRRQLPNGDIYVDIGTTEGLLPRRNQSSRESYGSNDKIKCYVEKVEKAERGLRVVLSRTSPELIRKLFEVEVPEIAQNQIDIIKIVREAGYRSKVAVASRNDDIDPVGACVGLKGNRIQTIMSEIEGEKIDILRYDTNPANYIRNALSPAQVKDVVIIDKNIYHAVAIVEDSQLSLAIGKQGLNVRLANKLVDWMIDVKTQAQFDEMDIAKEARSRAESIFTLDEPMFEPQVAQPEFEEHEVAVEPEVASFVDEDEIALSELPLDSMLLRKLQFHDVYSVEEFINLSDEELAGFSDLSEEEIIAIKDTINEYVDIVEDEEDGETEYVCPNCGGSITMDMTVCPSCGTGLAFEVE